MDTELVSGEKVICCFCGNSMSIHDSYVLLVYSGIDKEEAQQLYCHKQCLQGNLDNQIQLYCENLE